MERDIRNPTLLYVKAGLFVITGVLSATMLLVDAFSWRNLFLLLLSVWCFSRAYYFGFYVIEHYIDPNYKFAGLSSVITYLLRKRK